MGKKSKQVNKKDIKNSQISSTIWIASIGIIALIFSFVVMAKISSQQQNANNLAANSNQTKSVSQDQNEQKPIENVEQKTNEKVINADGKVEDVKPNNNEQQNQISQEELQKLIPQKQSELSIAQIETTKGNIQVVLQDKKMPITVGNFVKLVNSNFYNGLTFHRVEDWVIQGGDPNGNGSGGSKDTIPLETHPDLKNVRGAIAMARTDDPNSATSQFYILKNDEPVLDGQYAVFGTVLDGMDVVDKMEIGDKIISIKIQK